jgi:hypothetical protein
MYIYNFFWMFAHLLDSKLIKREGECIMSESSCENPYVKVFLVIRVERRNEAPTIKLDVIATFNHLSDPEHRHMLAF